MRGAQHIRRHDRTAMAALLADFALACTAAPCSSVAAPVASPAEPEPAWAYRVQPGDNLFDLSAAHLRERTSWRELQKLNRVADPLRLQPGSTLKLPIRLLRREAAVAQAVFVQGDVTLRRDATDAGLRTGDELRSGDALATGEQATLTLRFVDGSRLLVAPRSQVRLDELLVYGRSAVPAMRLQLQKGSADSKVVPSAGRPADYQLRTPSLMLGVRGTEFRVQVSDDGRSAAAEVIEGTVAAAPAGTPATMKMPAGYGVASTLGEKPPTALVKLLPAPSLAGVPMKLERLPLTLAWPPLEGALAYRAQLFDGEDHLRLDGRFESPRAQWATDLPDGAYRLRLRGIDANGLEGLAADQAVTLKARPEPPFARAPAAGARVYGDSAALAWTRPVNAKSFRLQIGTDADFTQPPILDRRDITATELSAALPPGTYFWRLASTAGDDGPWGDAQTFEQRPVPPTPPLQAPAVEGDQLRFAWSAAPGAARYELQWSADPEFKTLLAEPKTEQPTLALPRPGHGTYFLRVRSVDELGYAGPFGTPQRVELPRPIWPWLLPLLIVPFTL